MNLNFQISAVKNYFFGFATSGAILFAGLVYFNKAEKTEEPQENAAPINYLEAEKVTLKNFNPNNLSEAEWKSMGFSDRQVATILKYKSIVGGNFVSKQQLKKCYAISEQKFAEIEAFILLPETAPSFNGHHQSNANAKNYYDNSSNKTHYSRKELRIPGKFNPDLFTVDDFVKMGFTENQSIAILKYRNYLGGSFISKEKFKACFIISDENYKKMEPFLILPEKTPENFAITKPNYQKPDFKPAKAQIIYQNFDPNTMDLEGWKNLGFSEKQAQVIINYRDRNLRGSFKTLDDIERCFVISSEKFQEMKPYIVLKSESMIAQPTSSSGTNNNFTTKSTDQKTDFSKTNLNEITFKQLVEFGFDEKSAASLIGFRNKLGGFVNKDQILESYNIDRDLAQKLVNQSPLNTDQIQKYSLMDAPESWLKSHPYFKYYADKIIYYRISYTNENKFFRSMKVKPEYEAKMRLYLK